MCVYIYRQNELSILFFHMCISTNHLSSIYIAAFKDRWTGQSYRKECPPYPPHSASAFPIFFWCCDLCPRVKVGRTLALPLLVDGNRSILTPCPARGLCVCACEQRGSACTCGQIAARHHQVPLTSPAGKLRGPLSCPPWQRHRPSGNGWR